MRLTVNGDKKSLSINQSVKVNIEIQTGEK
jgi:hypothetical protein